MEQIFISYKRIDKDKVFPIVARIEKELGCKCWMDLDGIKSSAQFASVICRAIDAAEVVLFMHSSAHLNIDFETDWTVKELNYAQIKKKRVILVKLDTSQLDNIFLLEYGSKNNIDSFDPDQFKKLLTDLRSWLTRDYVFEPLCPCGSGKLFKDCHGKSLSSVSKVAADNKPQTQDSGDFVLKVKGVEYPMVFVEEGTFKMGSDDSEAYSWEKPVHQVTLNSYCIGKYEVTQELWVAVMGSNPSNFKGARRPVEQVSWDDCQEFIRKLNSLTGKNFKLPTEAQWEYAARGGKKSSGYKYSGSNTIGDVAWYTDNSGKKTHDVGTKIPNELGLYDMAGNVWEWCSDWYGDYSSSSQTNPSGSSSGSYRVSRGGCWNCVPGSCRLSDRSSYSPDDSFDILGFRLCL